MLMPLPGPPTTPPARCWRCCGRSRKLKSRKLFFYIETANRELHILFHGDLEFDRYSEKPGSSTGVDSDEQNRKVLQDVGPLIFFSAVTPL